MHHPLSRVIPVAFLLTALSSDPSAFQSVETDTALTTQRDGKVGRGCATREPNDESIVVAHIEFNDDGSFATPSQLKTALACIASARENRNGAVVVLFVHGWHHNAAWNTSTNQGDEHFTQFRRVLMSLALREAERYEAGGLKAGRRVVGLYLGWNGDPQGGFYGLVKKYVSTHATFGNRYRVASTVASGSAIRDTLRGVIEATKSGTGPDSPLALIGHSMGGMIVENAVEALLREKGPIGAPRTVSTSSCIRVERDGQPIVFPDLVLLLNSAGSRVAAVRVMQLLDQQRIRKVVTCQGITFQAPLVIAATSVGDTDTRIYFPIAMRGHTTAAFTPQLLTHRVTEEKTSVQCSPLPNDHLANTYNQSWHCLRSTRDANGAVTALAIDLPRAPQSSCHVRYRMSRIDTNRSTTPYWVFQFPNTIVDNHNDIFNGRSNLFIMGLMQLSGSVMSLAKQWSDVFEDEEGACR